MRVAVGGVVHDRWTVSAYLEGLRQLEAGPHTIVPAFVTDGDVDLLFGRYAWPVVVSYLPGLNYARATGNPEELRQIYERLAFLRNTLAQLVLSRDCEALLSVDSDIVVPPDLLVRLAAAERPWVSALVRNSATDRNCWNVFHYGDLERQGGLVRHFLPCGNGASGQSWPAMQAWDYDPRDATMARDLCAGAVTLYSREVLLRARWHSDMRGRQEDLGFAADAFSAGYRAAYMPIVCRHLTVDGVV